MSDYVSLADHKSTTADHRRAKALRRAPTVAEKILWFHLRLAAKDQDFRFRRQHPMHPYIVDFICLTLRLIIEIDGLSHETRHDRDNNRDADLLARGYETMRFTHDDVVQIMKE